MFASSGNDTVVDPLQYMDDLRDKRGGTYDIDPGTPREEINIKRTPHRDAQHGADVRETADYGSQTPPEGMIRERKGPLGPKHGRRRGNS